MLLVLSLGYAPQPGGLVLRKMCPAASRAAVPVAQAEDKGWDGEFREMPVEKATPLTDARRKAAQEQETTGCVPGGWDNEEYLEATKTGHAPPSNADALKQAIAYRDWLASQGHRPRQDVVDLIAELEAGMDPEELAGTRNIQNSGEDYLDSVGAGGTGQTEDEAEKRRREDQAMRDNFVKQQQQAFYSAPKTSAPKVEASGQGVVSANSYSAMMGGAAAAPAAPRPAPREPAEPGRAAAAPVSCETRARGRGALAGVALAAALAAAAARATAATAAPGPAPGERLGRRRPDRGAEGAHRAEQGRGFRKAARAAPGPLNLD